MLVIGHRGAAGHEPENTLRSVRRALDLHVDWVEVDVQAVDDELIIFHDDTLDRTTDGTGTVATQSFGALRNLDAGAGEQIPTLIEVMDLIGERAGLNIELKGPNTVEGVTRTITDYQARLPSWRGRILLSSFDEPRTESLAARDRDYELGVLFADDAAAALARAQRYDAYSIHPSIDQVNTDLVRQAQAAGLKVLVYTVNEPEDIASMRTLGVDGVFSDYPDRVIALR